MNNQPLEKIADIIAPLNPQPTVDYIFIYLFLFVLFIVIFIFFYMTKKQQFKRLKKQFFMKKINQRQFSIQLDKFLNKNNFYVNQYSVKNKLEIARFSRQGLNDKDMYALILNIEKWI